MKKKARRLSMRTKKSITGYLFISPFIIGFLLFLLSPVITSFAMSLSDVTLKTDGTGFGLDFWGLKSYIHALTIDKDFNRLLVETVRDLMIDVPCIIIFSLIIAVLLNRSFPGRGVVRAIFFMPVILTSGVIVGMERSNSLLMGIQDMQSAAVDTSITTTVQNLLLGAMGSSGQEIINLVVNIINHFYDIVVASSIQIVIFLSGLQAINPSIYEAADMEGCDEWQKMWKITIPMLTPMILVNWIYTIIDQFARTENPLMEKILTTISATMDYGYASSMAWIYCIVMLVLIGGSVLLISRMVYYYD
jgi:ABC-type sugar transport system permease subunit